MDATDLDSLAKRDDERPGGGASRAGRGAVHGLRRAIDVGRRAEDPGDQLRLAQAERVDEILDQAGQGAIGRLLDRPGERDPDPGPVGRGADGDGPEIEPVGDRVERCPGQPGVGEVGCHQVLDRPAPAGRRCRHLAPPRDTDGPRRPDIPQADANVRARRGDGPFGPNWGLDAGIEPAGPIGPRHRAVRQAAAGRLPAYRRSMVPTRPIASTRHRAPTRPAPPIASGGVVRRSAPTVRVRAIRPADHDTLRAFYGSLSDESRRTRFLGSSSGIGDGQSTWFCSPDHAHREGFIATIRGPRAGRIVGHVCIEPDGPASAEVAVAVADELQGRGIGRALVEAAVEWARRDGFGSNT